MSEEVFKKLKRMREELVDENVELPVAILDFGSRRLREKVNVFLVNYLSSSEFGVEDQVLETISRVMGCEIESGENVIVEELEFMDCKILTRKVIEELRERGEKGRENVENLDFAVRFDSLGN